MPLNERDISRIRLCSHICPASWLSFKTRRFWSLFKCSLFHMNFQKISSIKKMIKFSVIITKDSFTRLLTIFSQNNHDFKIRTGRSVMFVTFPHLVPNDKGCSKSWLDVP
ncbi:unnamed protein product [Moneuplotes crassus]|uniref:Uncharacterized protein n=1 Tax=Euplotes crassus TaxID=5936 RepID=A0AAD1U9N4_EUPCR|nr:unnamed protein product [Moneuplotes crassus]